MNDGYHLEIKTTIRVCTTIRHLNLMLFKTFSRFIIRLKRECELSIKQKEDISNTEIF